VAIKRLFKQDLDPETLADFKKEVEIMARLRHPNTLLFMGACTTPGNMSVVTEFLSGDVEHVLKKKDVDLSLYTRMRMLKELAQGMNWLHESKVKHFFIFSFFFNIFFLPSLKLFIAI
jgi:serine/threonine protein kinase